MELACWPFLSIRWAGWEAEAALDPDINWKETQKMYLASNWCPGGQDEPAPLRGSTVACFPRSPSVLMCLVHGAN